MKHGKEIMQDPDNGIKKHEILTSGINIFFIPFYNELSAHIFSITRHAQNQTSENYSKRTCEMVSR